MGMDGIFLGLAWYWWFLIVVLVLVSIPLKVKFLKWWSRRSQAHKEEQSGKVGWRGMIAVRKSYRFI